MQCKFFIEDQLEKRESFEDDPFTFLCLADQLQAYEQRERAVKYIAMQLFQRAPGRQRWGNRNALTNNFHRAYTDFIQRLLVLPSHLSGLIRQRRNEINDVTGQFEEEDQPSALAE